VGRCSPPASNDHCADHACNGSLSGPDVGRGEAKSSDCRTPVQPASRGNAGFRAGKAAARRRERTVRGYRDGARAGAREGDVLEAVALLLPGVSVVVVAVALPEAGLVGRAQIEAPE